jgi:hypothetical protein
MDQGFTAKVGGCLPIGYGQPLTKFRDPERQDLIDLLLDFGWPDIQRPIQLSLGQCSGHLVPLQLTHLGSPTAGFYLLIAIDGRDRKAIPQFWSKYFSTASNEWSEMSHPTSYHP